VRTLCLAVTACAIGLAGETALAQDRGALVVRTQSGPVRGVHNGAVDAFLGIPYGAPPVGDKRWRPPQPAESWNDIREAKAFGAYCAATKSTNGPRSSIRARISLERSLRTAVKMQASAAAPI
jgi:hypothetical protein